MPFWMRMSWTSVAEIFRDKLSEEYEFLDEDEEE